MISIRNATKADSGTIREVHLRAFPEAEAELVATLAVDLLGETTSPETISLVAEIDGSVAGHIAFSPVSVDARGQFTGYILGPLGIKPEYQKRRIGSKLIEAGLARLSEEGVDLVFVYGDPAYYTRFGFRAETAARYLPPYPLQYPFGWQAQALSGEGPTGQTVKISCVASLRDPALW